MMLFALKKTNLLMGLSFFTLMFGMVYRDD